jgi:hypothetical protein
MQHTSTSTAQHRSHAVTHQLPNTARDTEDKIQAFREHVAGRSVGIVHVIALLPFRVGNFGLPAGRRHGTDIASYGAMAALGPKIHGLMKLNSLNPRSRLPDLSPSGDWIYKRCAASR